jgi:cation transport ATPase
LLTRSFRQAFTALLLVNPRTAVIGAEAADLRASARALRGNVTVVGTRPERQVRLPDILLLDGPGALTEGFELQEVLALESSHEVQSIAECASAVATASGSPWGPALAAPDEAAPAVLGSCSGRGAAATISGVRYALGPVTVGDAVPSALHRRYHGSVLLALRRDSERDALGLIILRPRLAPGVPDLVAMCRQHGVAVQMLGVQHAAAGKEVARRAAIDYLDDHNALRVIRARQAEGTTVAFLSDSAAAGQAFAECDLAIGLSPGQHHSFPARADLLAPDLYAVAAIIDAGARRRAAVRDAVALSIVGNGAGVVWGLRGEVGVEIASHATFITALAAIAAGWLRLGSSPIPASSATAHPG